MLQPVSQGFQTSNSVRCWASISSTRGLLMECQLVASRRDRLSPRAPRRSTPLRTTLLEVSEHMPTFSDISDQLTYQAIELPSWAFGNSGTRFKVFGTPGTPRTVQEKLADAAKVNELDRARASRCAHIPWDKVGDHGALRTMPLILV